MSICSFYYREWRWIIISKRQLAGLTKDRLGVERQGWPVAAALPSESGARRRRCRRRRRRSDAFAWTRLEATEIASESIFEIRGKSYFSSPSFNPPPKIFFSKNFRLSQLESVLRVKMKSFQVFRVENQKCWKTEIDFNSLWTSLL